jgi:hypothetical protein
MNAASSRRGAPVRAQPVASVAASSGSSGKYAWQTDHNAQQESKENSRSVAPLLSDSGGDDYDDDDANDGYGGPFEYVRSPQATHTKARSTSSSSSTSTSRPSYQSATARKSSQKRRKTSLKGSRQQQQQRRKSSTKKSNNGGGYAYGGGAPVEDRLIAAGAARQVRFYHLHTRSLLSIGYFPCIFYHPNSRLFYRFLTLTRRASR